MNNKIQKLVVVGLMIFCFPISQAKADNYAGRGMLIGAGVVAVGGTIASSFAKEDCSIGCTPVAYKFAAFGLGAIVGGLVGAGIGALIPKHNNLELIPILSHSEEGSDVGVNLKVRF